MHGKRRIVSAAVFRVQYQCQVKQLFFQRGVFAIMPEHVQKISCGGQVRLRTVNNQAFIPVTVGMSLIAVNHQQRENGNQLDALSKHVRYPGVFSAVIKNIERQNALGNGVHDIATGKFKNRIVDKIIRQ